MRWAASGSFVASLVVVACARSPGTSSASPEPAAPTLDASEAAGTAPAPSVGDGRCPTCTDAATPDVDVQRAAAAMEAFAVAMCRCVTVECVQGVSAEMTRFGEEMAVRHRGRPTPVVPPDVKARFETSTRQLMDCTTRAMSGGAAPPRDMTVPR